MVDGRASQDGAARLAETVVASGYASIVLDRLARQACQLVDADGSCVIVQDREMPGTTIAAAGCGRSEALVGDRLAEGFLDFGWLDAGAARSHVDVLAPGGGQGRRTRVAIPIRRQGQVCGALAADAPARRSFDERELAALSELAKLAGAALDHAEQRAALLPQVRARVVELVEAIDARDGYTAAHSESVVELSRAVGRRFELGAPDLLELELAALFHDLGKLGVPDSVLNKPGPLDPEERALMRRHTEWGAAILANVPALEAVATIVRCHHERWDGTGYPNGIAGERIPIASRIVAVADAYDAMTSDRPYRKALPQAVALEELRAGAGSQFDPTCVELLVAEVEAGGERAAGDGESGPPSELWLSADPAELARARQFVDEAAASFGFAEDERFALTFAVNEAVSNAIEHGSSSGVGRVRLSHAVEDDALAYYVEDSGAFAPQAPTDEALPDRGRGLAFMANMVDELDLRPSAEGTMVRLAKRRC